MSVSEVFKPEKSVWSDSDFDTMGWHDATIHAIAFPTEEFEVVLDIDYILDWVDPAEGQTHFRFWVSPATLVFWNTYDLSVDLDTLDEITIEGIERSDPAKPRNATAVRAEIEWRWTIECHEGEIKFRSCGFWQYLRALPRLGKSQSIAVKERGGYSFERPDEWLRQDI